jgi:hypothetical protein
LILLGVLVKRGGCTRVEAALPKGKKGAEEKIGHRVVFPVSLFFQRSSRFDISFVFRWHSRMTLSSLVRHVLILLLVYWTIFKIK